MLIRGKGGKERTDYAKLDKNHPIFNDLTQKVFEDKTSQFTILDMKSPCL